MTDVRTVSLRVTSVATIRDVEPPRIDTRKKWRRVQVLLKRANAAMEGRMLAALYGVFP